ncbi:MAG: response regulator [Desulfobulbaceae bacterium]|nr:response regulator [Desulfobulbaceae bacterium]
MAQTTEQAARILVIDDDKDIWKAYRLVLSPEGLPLDSSSAKLSQLLNEGAEQRGALADPTFDLSFASQGKEGHQMVTEALEKSPFAMAFIDVRMPPGWDGMETAIKIRQLDPNIELVIVTAYSDRSLDEIVHAVGSNDKLLFLRKPFDPDELKQIARCLTSKWNIARKERQQRHDQRILEEQLRQAQKMESIGTLAGGIAHDFNNILSAIVGYTDLAMMRSKENTVIQDDLSQVRKASMRAADLVRQILTFSRREPKELQPLQISLVIKEAMKLLRASIPSTIAIHQEISSEATVLADPTQIHQLIMNLCTNAFHSMADHGGTLSVSLSETELGQNTSAHDTLPPGRYVNLTVSDTGHGMEQATVSKIFEPYFTTKESGKGTGLGLAVVHGIVEGHHGRITVESQTGCGTTFIVSLPVATMQPSRPSVSAQPLSSTNHERIMVVEDDESIRDLTRQFLAEAGYQVDLFSNGTEAWQALSQNPTEWQLLFTDQTMPGMTGEQLAAKVKALSPQIPVILASGYVPNIKTILTPKTGVSAYIQKPVDRDTLLSTVAKALACPSTRSKVQSVEEV